MSDTIKGSIIGAFITVVGSVLIFVLGNFSTQSTIEKNTVETLSRYFDSVDKDMSYEQALQTIYKENENLKSYVDELNNQVNMLNTKISEKQTEIDRQYSTEVINEIIYNATEYGNDSNFIQALSILNSASKTLEIETLIEEYTKKYENQIVAEANGYTNKGEYNKAADVITNALNIIPNNLILKQKLEDIQNSMPQNLLNAIKPYETNGYSEKIGEYMEMGGEKYYNGFQLGVSFATSFAIFNLNSKYTQITGIIGHIDESGDADKVIAIFADDVLVETININYQDLPKEFFIDVTGVNKLKIERTDGETQTGFGNLNIK